MMGIKVYLHSSWTVDLVQSAEETTLTIEIYSKLKPPVLLVKKPSGSYFFLICCSRGNVENVCSGN